MNGIINGECMSQELIFLKPDCIERKLVGKVIERFENAGFRIVKMKKGRISEELARLLYADSETQLTGMGNKTIKAMTDRGNAAGIKALFGTDVPYEIGKELNSWNRKYALSADVIAMIIEKDGDAVTEARTLVGKTDPSIAAKGTIRGDWGADTIYDANTGRRAVRNIVHASDVDTAEADLRSFETYFFG